MRGFSKNDEDAWAELVPVDVETDGNCLVHAARKCVSTEDDKKLELRQALYEHMVKHQDVFYGSFVRYQTKWNESLGMSSFSLSQEQWKREWADVLDYAKPKEGKFQKSLEPIHVYALADLLRRPIIIFAKQVPNTSLPSKAFGFAGIYLPNISDSYWHSDTVIVNPILLAYDYGHFKLLLINSRSAKTGADQLSISGENGKCMPIHFSYGSSDDANDHESDGEEVQISQFSQKIHFNRKLRLYF